MSLYIGSAIIQGAKIPTEPVFEARINRNLQIAAYVMDFELLKVCTAFKMCHSLHFQSMLDDNTSVNAIPVFSP